MTNRRCALRCAEAGIAATAALIIIWDQNRTKNTRRA